MLIYTSTAFLYVDNPFTANCLPLKKKNLAVHPPFLFSAWVSINNKMIKEYCSTANPNIVQDNFSLALFDFPF